MNVNLATRGRIEYQVTSQDADYGTPVITWTLLAVVWMEVQDVPPSRSESVRQGLEVARNQTRIRYRYRTDVDSSMRIVISGPVVRTLQIVAGPMELGRHEYSEVVAEAIST